MNVFLVVSCTADPFLSVTLIFLSFFQCCCFLFSKLFFHFSSGHLQVWVCGAFCSDSPSPGPAGRAAGWWSAPPGSTPPATPCRPGRSRSPASFPGGSTNNSEETLQSATRLTSPQGLRRCSYRFEFGHVPLQVLCHPHHLGDDVLQLLPPEQTAMKRLKQSLAFPQAQSTHQQPAIAGCEGERRNTEA